MFPRLKRRWHARKWRCRCGARVFDSHGGRYCKWHTSVQTKVLNGMITRAEDAR